MTVTTTLATIDALGAYLRQAGEVAKEHGIAVADVIDAHHALLRLYGENGQRFDEQMAGIVQHLQALAAAVERIAREH